MKRTNHSSADNLGYTPDEYVIFKKYAWLFLASLSFLNVCANCCKLNLSAAIPLMTQDGWTTSELGIVTGIFFWVYAAGQIINGRLSEIVGSRILLILASLLTGVLNFIIGFQNTLAAIAVLWALNGLAQSMIWAPGMTSLSKWWPESKRGFATGFVHSFNGLGQGVCVLVVSLAFALMPGAGWKAAFFLPAIPPIIAAVIHLTLTKQDPEALGLREYTEQDPEMQKQEEELERVKAGRGSLYPYIFLLKMPSFVIWLFIAFIIGIARFGLLTWIPYYFVDHFGVSISSGLLSTFIIPLGMAVGTLVVPWLTDIFCPKNRLPAVIISGILAALVVWLFYITEPRITANILLFFAGFFIYAINGLCWTFATDIGGRVFAGTASGLLNFASYIGAGCQAAIFGFALKASGWSLVFITIVVSLGILVLLAFAADRTRKTKSKAGREKR